MLVDWVGDVVVSVEVALDLFVCGFGTLVFLEFEDGLVDLVGGEEDVDGSESKRGIDHNERARGGRRDVGLFEE